MRTAAYLTVSLVLLALLGGCSSDSEGDPIASPDSSPTPDPTAIPTAEPLATVAPFHLSSTVLIAPLTTIYKAGSSEPPTAGELPFPPDGKVEARWYQTGDFYVVHYAGLALADIVPVCPGNSIRIVTDFKHVSNSPSTEGACTGAPALAVAPDGLKICEGEVLYLTEIPTKLIGELHATVERYFADGAIVGLSSFIDTDAFAAPEVDLTTCTPAVP